MAIEFSCESCGKPYRLAERLAGRQAKCACGHVMQVPSPVPAHADGRWPDDSALDESAGAPLPAPPITQPPQTRFWENPGARRAVFAIISVIILMIAGAFAIRKMSRRPSVAVQAPQQASPSTSSSATDGTPAAPSNAATPSAAAPLASSPPQNPPSSPPKTPAGRHRTADLRGAAYAQCCKNMLAVGEALSSYAVHNGGEFPPNMGQLLWEQGVNFSSLKPEKFLCPNSGKTVPANLTGQDLRDWITKNTDYASPAIGSHNGVERLLLYEKWVSDKDEGTTVLEMVRAQPQMRWVSIAEAKRLIAEEREATGR